MANEVVQAGTDIIVGAHGMAYSGYLITDATVREGYEASTKSLDYSGNVRGKQRAGKYVEINITAEVDDPGDDNEVIRFAPGEAATITFPNDAGTGEAITGEWQDDVETRMLQGETQKVLISGTIRKEDTMTYS